jgi:hypothetical protein
MIFDELKHGDRFRVSGEIVELTRVAKTEIDGRFINSEYVSGPYKNEFVFIYGSTKVRRVKQPQKKLFCK